MFKFLIQLLLIKADSLIHNRNTRFSEGFNNIIIENRENNVTIFGDHLLDDKEFKCIKNFWGPVFSSN